MTKAFLIVSVACNVWFLFLLFYDRIMDTKLIRFFRHIAGLWRSLDSTVAEQGKDKEIPHADTSDIIGRKKLLLTTETRKPSHARHKYRRTNSMKPSRASRPRNWSTEKMNRRMKNQTKSRLREVASRILTWQYTPYGRNHHPMRKCDTPERS